MSERFRALHAPGELLILANAWDAGSARLIESLGAPAIATTSCGVAWANGYPDGDTLPVDTVLATLRAVARVVRVPVSSDIEGGYSDEPAAVGTLAARLVEAGAVGINIEDGAGPPALLAAKISAVKAAAPDLFVNARTDVALRGLATGAARDPEIARRAALYREAGADGLFVPGLADTDGIRAAVGAAGPLPVNIMALPALPDAAGLKTLGVRRLSAGGRLAEAALGLTRRLAASFLADGRSDALYTGEGLAYSEAQALFSARRD